MTIINFDKATIHVVDLMANGVGRDYELKSYVGYGAPDINKQLDADFPDGWQILWRENYPGGDDCPLDLSEYVEMYDPDGRCKLAPDEMQPFDAWVRYECPDCKPADQLISDFRDKYVGERDSESDFAREIVDEYITGSGKEDLLALYFDYETFERDLFMSDYYALYSDDGACYIFHRY